VQRHLKICHECSKKFAFEAELITQVRVKLQRIDLPSGLMERLSQTLSQSQEE